MNKVFFLAIAFSTGIAAPQQDETKDQLEVTDPITESSDSSNKSGNREIAIVTKERLNAAPKEESHSDVGFSIKIYQLVTDPIAKIIRAPKVNAVLRNIGTCIVNGAMELFSFYLPPSFLPLVASAAGLVIPFEPVVMLREKMPVTTYRRAFNTAMASFLRTFDKYKVEDEFDPYMTRRFNRRFMGDDGKKNNE